MRMLLVGLMLVLPSCELKGVPNADYGIRLHLDEWDEIDIISRARLITQVACNSPASEAGIVAGDWLVRIDTIQISGTYRTEYERGIRILQAAHRPVKVGICRGKCKPATETNKYNLTPRVVDWDKCNQKPTS